MNEVLTVIKAAKCGKAYDLDGIPTEILKCHGLHTYLFKLFNVCFEQGRVPSQWLQSVIHPIPKGTGSDIGDPSLTRGISRLMQQKTEHVCSLHRPE